MKSDYKVEYKLIDEMSDEEKTIALKKIYQICMYISNLEKRFSDDKEDMANWLLEVFEGKEPHVTHLSRYEYEE